MNGSKCKQFPLANIPPLQFCAILETMKQATRNGRPVGEYFFQKIEKFTGRTLQRQKTRPKKKAKEIKGNVPRIPAIARLFLEFFSHNP
jgi:hypothetical protein